MQGLREFHDDEERYEKHLDCIVEEEEYYYNYNLIYILI